MSLFDPHGLYFRRKHSSHKGQVNTKKPTKIPDCDIADGTAIEKSMKIMKGLGYSLVRGKSVTVPIIKTVFSVFDDANFHSRDREFAIGIEYSYTTRRLWQEAYETMSHAFENIIEENIVDFTLVVKLRSVTFYGLITDDGEIHPLGTVNVNFAFDGVNSREENLTLHEGESSVACLLSLVEDSSQCYFRTTYDESTMEALRDGPVGHQYLTLKSYSGSEAFHDFFTGEAPADIVFRFYFSRSGTPYNIVISDVNVSYSVVAYCNYRDTVVYPIDS